MDIKDTEEYKSTRDLLNKINMISIEEFIGIKAEYDHNSGFISGVNEYGKVQPIADVRGWGAIIGLFGDDEAASVFQDKLGLFIANAITEKINKKPKQLLDVDWKSDKQETLEEREPYWDLVDKKAEENNSIDLDVYAKGVQDGAKYMQKQMYSEEEVKHIIEKTLIEYSDYVLADIPEWFEQFKKR